MRRRKVKVDGPNKTQIGMCLDGKRTNIWFDNEEGLCIGTLDKRKLYRLAKAITNQFERV